MVTTGVRYSILADILYDGKKYDSATITVLQTCPVGLDKCVLQLVLPEEAHPPTGSVRDRPWCDIFVFKKMLSGASKTPNKAFVRRLGAIDEDKTRIYESQTKMLYPRRRLGDSSKDPLRERMKKKAIADAKTREREA